MSSNHKIVGRWCTHACSTGQGCDDCADCVVNGCDTCTSPETSSPILLTMPRRDGDADDR